MTELALHISLYAKLARQQFLDPLFPGLQFKLMMDYSEGAPLNLHRQSGNFLKLLLFIE